VVEEGHWESDGRSIAPGLSGSGWSGVRAFGALNKSMYASSKFSLQERESGTRQEVARQYLGWSPLYPLVWTEVSKAQGLILMARTQVRMDCTATPLFGKAIGIYGSYGSSPSTYLT
jgi:hypothetical protein